jgi:hypothetical protein
MLDPVAAESLRASGPRLVDLTHTIAARSSGRAAAIRFRRSASRMARG